VDLTVGEWLAIEEWAKCAEMARPGIVFEVRNAEGLTLLTPCTAARPPTPFDWRTPGIEFRAVVEAPPQRSAPLPPPRG
jgi:hypothetical protein